MSASGLLVGHRVLLAVALATCVAACGGEPSNAIPSPSASALVSNTTAATVPIEAPPPTTVFTRNKTPAERFAEDHEQCKTDAAACRRLADRYGADRRLGGCGIDRERPKPFIKRIASDTERDRLELRKALASGCKLGDQEACRQLEHGHEYAPDRAGRWRLAVLLEPELEKKLEQRRAICRLKPNDCAPPEWLIKRPKVKPIGALPAEVKAAAEQACAETHDCLPILRALDQAQVSVENLAPLRSFAAEKLAEGCKDGDCSCADAALLLSESDPRVMDLARLGCDNGEAEGCFLLARELERSKEPKDALQAATLYQLSCPPYDGAGPGELRSETSDAACDRLAQKALGGDYPGKDRTTARYYASRACHTGSAFDHRFCLNLAMIWAIRPVKDSVNRREAAKAAYGDSAYYNNELGECLRPSVTKECEALKKVLPPPSMY